MVPGCVDLDWHESIMWYTFGTVPGASGVVMTTKAVRQGRSPTTEELAISGGISVGTALLIARYGSPAVKEVATYMTISGAINVPKTAFTGKLAWRLVPRMLPWVTYGLVVYDVSTWIAEGTAPKMKSEFGRDARMGTSPFTGGMTGPIG